MQGPNPVSNPSLMQLRQNIANKKRLSDREITQDVTGELSKKIHPAAMRDVLEAADILTANDARLTQLKPGQYLRYEKGWSKENNRNLPRTIEIGRNPITGEYELILETKSKTAYESGTKDANAKMWAGGFKRVKPSFRIDKRYAEPYVTAVLTGPEARREADAEMRIVRNYGLQSPFLLAAGESIAYTGHSRQPLRRAKPMLNAKKPDVNQAKVSLIMPRALGSMREYIEGKLMVMVPSQSHPGQSHPQPLRLSYEQRLNLEYSVLLGMQALHANGIAHRDIKPDNIMIFYDQNMGGYYAKIADFGLAIPIQEARKHGIGGTLGYESPEISQATYSPNNAQSHWHDTRYPSLGRSCFYRDAYFRQQAGQSMHNPSHQRYVLAHTGNDIWALGVSFYELAYPSEDLSRASQLDHLVSLANDPTQQYVYDQMLIKMLNPDPSRRANIDQLLQDPVYQNTYLARNRQRFIATPQAQHAQRMGPPSVRAPVQNQHQRPYSFIQDIKRQTGAKSLFWQDASTQPGASDLIFEFNTPNQAMHFAQNVAGGARVINHTAVVVGPQRGPLLMRQLGYDGPNERGFYDGLIRELRAPAVQRQQRP